VQLKHFALNPDRKSVTRFGQKLHNCTVLQNRLKSTVSFFYQNVPINPPDLPILLLTLKIVPNTLIFPVGITMKKFSTHLFSVGFPHVVGSILKSSAFKLLKDLKLCLSCKESIQMSVPHQITCWSGLAWATTVATATTASTSTPTFMSNKDPILGLEIPSRAI